MAKKQNVSKDVNEVVDEQTGEVKRALPANLNFETVKEDLEKWNFQKFPIFIGLYKRTETFEFSEKQKDGTYKDKIFDLYVFEEYETGQRYHIDSCHSIQKFFEDEKAAGVDFTKFVYSITFIGKKMVKEKPLNTFTIAKAAI